MTKSKIQMTKLVRRFLADQCQNSNVKEKISFVIKLFGFILAFELCHLELYLPRSRP